MPSNPNESDFFEVPEGNEQAFFWIRKVDQAGFPVQLRFVEAAYSKAKYFRDYRAAELPDLAVRAYIVEDSVYCASRAQLGGEVGSTKGYLVTTVTRRIDKQIVRDSQIVFRGGNNPAAANTDPQVLQNEILFRQLLANMPPEDRPPWEAQLLGFKIKEIAAKLDIAPDTLSARMQRSARELKKRLLGLKPEGKTKH